MSPELIEALRDVIFMFENIERARRLPATGAEQQQYVAMGRHLRGLLAKEMPAKSHPSEFQRRGQEARLAGEGRVYTPSPIDGATGRTLMVQEFAAGWDEIDAALGEPCACLWCEEERAAGRDPTHEGVPPKAKGPTYFVQATYATPSGRMGLWAGRMASATGDILADAERLIRKYRKVAGKLTITATALI